MMGLLLFPLVEFAMWGVAGIAFLFAIGMALYLGATRDVEKGPSLALGCLITSLLIGGVAAGVAMVAGSAWDSIAPPPAPKAPDLEGAAPNG